MLGNSTVASNLKYSKEYILNLAYQVMKLLIMQENNMPSPKKGCGAIRTTIKEKQSPSKDSQTIAAKVCMSYCRCFSLQ